ncbi:hypothetical protein IAT38_001242 [Cryptococcus sp. DSM 104549]
MAFVPSDPNAEFDFTQYLEPTLLDKHDDTAKQSDFSQLLTPSIACAGSSPTAHNPMMAGHHARVANVGVLPTWEEEGWRELFDAMGLRQTGVDTYDCQTVAAEPSPTGTRRSSGEDTASPVPSEDLDKPAFDVQSLMAVDVPPQGNFHQLDNVTHRNFTMLDPQESIAPAMTVNLGTQVGHDMANRRYNAHSQFDLASLFGKLGQEPPAQAPQQAIQPQASFADFSQFFVPPPAEPSHMSIQPDHVLLKRKVSHGAVDDGREPKRRDPPSVFSANLPRPFQALNQPYMQQQLPDMTPLPLSPANSNDAASESTPSKSSSPSAAGKPSSTARPKSVVPEKFLNDGSAEAALGMSVAEIQSFPTFEELLKKVHPSRFARAKKFGEKIAKNRDKAKNAAKRSRDQRRAKIEKAEVLEKKTEELEAQVGNMKSLLMQLVERGVVGKDVVSAYL